MSSEMQRIEVRLKNPNPLFEQWILGWIARAQHTKARSEKKLRVALEALRSYPLPLASGRDCAILRGFGPGLCKMIDKKLEVYKKDNLEEFNKSVAYADDVKEVTKIFTNKVPSANTTPVTTPKKPRKASPRKKPSPQQVEPPAQITMSPGAFKIILIVDTHEANGKSQKFINEARCYLESQNILFEVRRLTVGDFCWIARNEANEELILPYIVERKRMDDFASSIRDGRFHEQKFRLRDSGIKNLIYLVENYGANQYVGLPMPTLMQAATNTQIHSNFQIKFTDNHRDSFTYLSVLTKILTDIFKTKVLIGTPKEVLQPLDMQGSFIGLMPFNDFQEGSTKNKDPKVREIFIKQLLQLKTLSINKALAIVEQYPTPRALYLAYEKCSTPNEAENLLTNIRSGKLKRPVGVFISKAIYKFYHTVYKE